MDSGVSKQHEQRLAMFLSATVGGDPAMCFLKGFLLTCCDLLRGQEITRLLWIPKSHDEVNRTNPWIHNVQSTLIHNLVPFLAYFPIVDLT